MEIHQHKAAWPRAVSSILLKSVTVDEESLISASGTGRCLSYTYLCPDSWAMVKAKPSPVSSLMVQLLYLLHIPLMGAKPVGNKDMQSLGRISWAPSFQPNFNTLPETVCPVTFLCHLNYQPNQTQTCFHHKSSQLMLSVLATPYRGSDSIRERFSLAN